MLLIVTLDIDAYNSSTGPIDLEAKFKPEYCHLHAWAVSESVEGIPERESGAIDAATRTRQYTINSWTMMIAKSLYGAPDLPSTIVHHTHENTFEPMLTQAWDFEKVVFILMYLLVLQLWSAPHCKSNKA